jgi:NTE family protein
VDGSIADDLPAKRLSRLYSTNHYIVSMVNPIAIPFVKKEGSRSTLGAALGTLGVGMGREILNFYRGMVQRQGDNWPRFNMLMNSVHALMDQEYSGDINIVPSFRWYNPAKILSHLSEKDLIELMEGGEHSTYPAVEAIRICTRISRTMEEILNRFETGDLRPDASEFHRPRASRRRPPPTRADRERTAGGKSRSRSKSTKPAAARKKASARGKASTGSKATTAPSEGEPAARTAA